MGIININSLESYILISNFFSFIIIIKKGTKTVIHINGLHGTNGYTYKWFVPYIPFLQKPFKKNWFSNTSYFTIKNDEVNVLYN